MIVNRKEIESFYCRICLSGNFKNILKSRQNSVTNSRVLIAQHQQFPIFISSHFFCLDYFEADPRQLTILSINFSKLRVSLKHKHSFFSKTTIMTSLFCLKKMTLILIFQQISSQCANFQSSLNL